MTKADVNRIYTEKVSELLAQGYQIHTESMGGSEGEIAHIDFIKGGELLRLLLDRGSDYSSACSDYLILRLGRHTEPLRGNRDTIWNGRLETLSEIKLAKVTDNYFTTMEEGAAISEKRFARWKNSARTGTARRKLGDAYKSAALRWLQKQPRMKTCKLEDVESVARVNKTAWGKTLPDLDFYEIKARGKVYQIKVRREA